MPVERREQVIAVGASQLATGGAPILDGRRQPSFGGTSRMMREYQVRICERLGVKFPGLLGNQSDVQNKRDTNFGRSIMFDILGVRTIRTRVTAVNGGNFIIARQLTPLISTRAGWRDRLLCDALRPLPPHRWSRVRKRDRRRSVIVAVTKLATEPPDPRCHLLPRMLPEAMEPSSTS